MSDVGKINQELLDYSRKLALAVNEYDTACVDAANKRTDRDVRWAQEMLRSEGKTVADREAEVMVICEAIVRECRISEAMRDALKERIRALQSVLNAAQTRAAFLKAEMKINQYE
jgi:Iap family predicted aminopeptidase